MLASKLKLTVTWTIARVNQRFEHRRVRSV